MRPQLLLAALLAPLLSSCFSPGDGEPPPLDQLYFPTGVVLDKQSRDDPGPSKYLYVASSDFDLQYRSSALLAFDLDLVRAAVPRSCASNADCGDELCDTTPTKANDRAPSFFCVARPANADGSPPCAALGARSPADQLLYPGRCNAEPSASLIHDQVGIGAFASDLIVRNSEIDQKPRLFLPVRGDATLHWIDLNDGHFECGQDNTSDDSCDDLHRAGDSTAENNDELRQPSEPFGVDATPDGHYVAVTNQTSGSVSLFVNDWTSPLGPTLENVLTGLPEAPVAVAALSPPQGSSPELAAQAEGFLVGYRTAALIDLLRVRTDAPVEESSSASYTRYTLIRAASSAIGTNTLGFDSRGIAIDQSNVYVANRAPASLLIGAMPRDPTYPAGSSQLPAFTDSIALTTGPSRVVLGKIKAAGNAQSMNSDDYGPYQLEPRVFVVCFDSRRIFVYDPERRVIDSIIDTGRGPYALAIDDARALGYVAHFTDSYLGVISLDQRFPQTYATIVASIGTPTPPRTSK